MLCTPCYKKGDAGELQGVTGEDKRKIDAFVREECAGNFGDSAFLLD
jgi:hypothetical protein